MSTAASRIASPSAAAKEAGVPGRLLQRACKCGSGNDAGLTGACDECAGKRLQAKLEIGPTGDRYEQEADRVADAVMRAPGGGRPVAGAISRVVQRAASPGGAAATSVPPQVDAVLAGAGRPLDAATRAWFEPRFGHDFGRVRVHHDGAAAASARAVDAIAYTVGEHVVFDSGRYAPEDRAGRRLLAHELTHVVQQGGMLRRASASAPLVGSVAGEDEAEVPLQRLQRTPAIVGFDEAGPKADLSGGEHESAQLKQLGDCMKQKGPDPNECDPPRALTWADFTATPDPTSRFGAVTGSTIETIDIHSQECAEQVLGRATGPKTQFQGLFHPETSWVKPNMRDAADPAKNGSAAQATKCRSDMDAAVAAGNAHPTWAFRTTPDPVCAASARALGTPATTKAECDTKIVADFTQRAVAESARLLNHEAHHYKLTCALAKKANGLLWRGTSFAAIDAVIRDRRRTTQKQYDDETEHGCKAADQSRWEADIAAGLPAVVLP